MAEGEVIKVRTFKRTEFIEVGRDTFDENVGKFFTAVGMENVVQVLPLMYEHIDITSQKVVSDYGLTLIYRAKK